MFGRSVRKTLNPEGGGEERGGGGGGAISTEERVQRGPNNWPHQGQPPILSAIQRATPKSNTIGEISFACHSKSPILFFKQHLSPLPNHSENHNAPWSPFSFNNFCKRLSLVKSRLALGSFGCHHAENGLTHRKMVVDCPKVITFRGDTLFQTRPDLFLLLRKKIFLYSKYFPRFLLRFSSLLCRKNIHFFFQIFS